MSRCSFCSSHWHDPPFSFACHARNVKGRQREMSPKNRSHHKLAQNARKRGVLAPGRPASSVVAAQSLSPIIIITGRKKPLCQNEALKPRRACWGKRAPPSVGNLPPSAFDRTCRCRHYYGRRLESPAIAPPYGYRTHYDEIAGCWHGS